MRSFWLCSSLLVGCNGGLPQPSPYLVVARGSLLMSVMADDSLMAIVSSPTASRGPALEAAADGRLQVLAPLGPGSPIPVDEGVARVFGFTPGGYLVYGVGIDSASGGQAFWPRVWKSGWAQPVPLSADPIATVIFSDGDIIYTSSDQFTGTLSVLSLSLCDSGACQLLPLGDATGFDLTTDGTGCVFKSLVPDGVDLFYVDGTQALPSLVAHLANADVDGLPPLEQLIAISADGTRLAHMTPGAGLQVQSTADLSPLAWSALPDGATLVGMVYRNADTLLLEVKAEDGSFLYESTANAMRRIAPAGHFDEVINDNHQLVTAFLYPDTSASPSPATFAVSAVDFATGNTVQMAQQTSVLPDASSDGAAAFVVDFTDSTGRGSMSFVDLSSLFSPTGPDFQALGLSATWSAEFIRHSSELVYFDARVPDAIFTFTSGGTPIQVATDAQHFQTTASKTLYWESAAKPSTTGSSQLQIFTRPL